MSLLKNIFHVVALAHHLFSLFYIFCYLELPLELSKTKQILGKIENFKYLTNWDVILQTLYFILCMICDVSSDPRTSGKCSRAKQLRELVLSSLVVPVSLFVGVTFWGLYIINRELVFPAAIDPYFPVWLNHMVHTNVVIFSMTELLTSYQEYPPRSKGIRICQIFTLTYILWSCILQYYTGYWVYPILQVLNWPLRIAFFFTNVLTMSLLYIIGEKINYIRRPQTTTKKN
ncbi:androgen-induced gene 1 protein-like [Cylas formicarius]|uniref:androgen-induced gene 1 protein-like n=1 Tax=Cylas formicarius TaxID=197179 RepID=UPI002958BF30|nr:androgen-induced gene 1 protein-like [Cylas formicarius]